MSLKTKADTLLQTAAESGDVPGVVAAATDRDETIYEGGFGSRVLGFEMGGGGLYSTVGDYLKVIRMMLNGGRAGSKQVLKPETVELMSRNAMGECRVTMLHTVIPPVTKDAEFFPGMPKGWGLTFMINNEQAPTGRSAGSLAWAGLANSYYWIDP